MAQMFTEIRKKTKSQQAILPGYPAKAATWHLLIHLLWKDLSHRSPLDQSYKPLLSLKKQKKKSIQSQFRRMLDTDKHFQQNQLSA